MRRFKKRSLEMTKLDKSNPGCRSTIVGKATGIELDINRSFMSPFIAKKIGGVFLLMAATINVIAQTPPADLTWRF